MAGGPGPGGGGGGPRCGGGEPEPHPPHHGVAHEVEVLVRIHERHRPRLVARQHLGHALRPRHRLPQRASELAEQRALRAAVRRQGGRLLVGGGGGGAHLGEEGRRAAVAQLAAEEGVGVHAGGAFMDHVEPIVAVELLHRVVVHVPGPAEDLDGPLVRLEAPLGRPRLDHRREELEQQQLVRPRRGVGRGGQRVDDTRRVHAQPERALDVRLLQQQHPLDIRVLDDRHHRRARVAAERRAALRALPRVLQRVEVAREGGAHAAEPDLEAELVHHDEHAMQPLVRLADKVAGGATRRLAKQQLARVDARRLPHLMVKPSQPDVVALAERDALLAERERMLRDEEEGDALGAGGRPRQLGEHHVHDGASKVVFRGGDPHLVSADLVRAVGLRVRRRADVRQRRASVRLGEAHGTAPIAAEQLREHVRALLVGAVVLQDLCSADVEREVRREAGVCGRKVQPDGAAHCDGHLRPSHLGVHRRGEEAGVGIGAVRRDVLGQ
mmetsp:Transcript_28953/g.87653  ORF Transcript_28953/g.87653 Transcript_28953/m.87653 type:complete len:498 (+) Transcript_28953:29-1522(+)